MTASSRRQSPQPDPSRIVPFRDHPILVGIVPGQPNVVALTALALAEATAAPRIAFAYVDPTRYVVDEAADGSITHLPLDPDSDDRSWHARRDELEAAAADIMRGHEIPWEFYYLVGRADRALTHLARGLDAAAFVVGTRAPGARERVREFVDGSVAVQLARHQHRPVIAVPTSIVDWKAPIL